jgi:hypothetical protein
MPAYRVDRDTTGPDPLAIGDIRVSASNRNPIPLRPTRPSGLTGRPAPRPHHASLAVTEPGPEPEPPPSRKTGIGRPTQRPVTVTGPARD